MQGRQRAMGDRPEEREMQNVNVKMNDVEAIRLAMKLIEQAHILKHRIVAFGREANRAGRAWDELGARHRIARGEQSHLVAGSHQFLG